MQARPPQVAVDEQDAPAPTRPPRSGPDGERRPDEEYLADYYRWLADAEFRGHDPLYERIARAMADEAVWKSLLSRRGL